MDTGEIELPGDELVGFAPQQDVKELRADLHGMPPARKGKRVRYAARLVPYGVRHGISDAGNAGDPDGWNAGGKWIVGLAGNQQVARDVEVLAADTIERLEDVPVVGDGQLIQHGGRDQSGVSQRRVLLALGAILTEERMRVEAAAKLVDVLNPVAPEEPVLVAEVVVDSREELTIISRGCGSRR